MLQRRFAAIAMAVLPLFAVGCTVNGPDAPPQAPPSGSENGLNLPKRPHDLPVAGLDEARACQLITPEQQAQLGVDAGAPQAQAGSFKTPGCLWMSHGTPTNLGATITVAPMGIADAEASKSSSPETAEQYAIAGFGAVQGQTPGAEDLGCFVDVDAANGQTLETGVTWLGGPHLPNEEMCAKAKQVAEFAVGNLQQQG